jgi:hypothetical protein
MKLSKLYFNKYSFAINYKSRYFVDFKMSTVKAGKGGDGQVSFLHTKETEWGGPDGGK